jgi:hypothetical protein
MALPFAHRRIAIKIKILRSEQQTRTTTDDGELYTNEGQTLRDILPTARVKY